MRHTRSHRATSESQVLRISPYAMEYHLEVCGCNVHKHSTFPHHILPVFIKGQPTDTLRPRSFHISLPDQNISVFPSCMYPSWHTLPRVTSTFDNPFAMPVYVQGAYVTIQKAGPPHESRADFLGFLFISCPSSTVSCSSDSAPVEVGRFVDRPPDLP